MESSDWRDGRPSASLRRRAILAAVFSATTALAVLAVLAFRSAGPGAAPGGGGTASASTRVDAGVRLAGGSPIRIPRSFLGISAEYWTIPTWGHQARQLSRVFAMLSTDGSIRLRIGGDSADRAQWSPTKELPEWVFELTPSWLHQTSRIVRATGSALILDLNTMSSTPKLAARWARTALAGLPAGSVHAFEVGNEPDVYNQGAWHHMTAGPGAPPLPSHITAAGYAHSFAAYARAVERVAHGVPLLAPALAEPQKNAEWISQLLAAPHPNLIGVTAHRYPYSACARTSAPTYPTIPRVLSEDATAGMGRTAVKLEHMSDPARLPLWLTEVNSVTCGGTRGVSDTFATALWAPDALFELLRAGTEAAFVHIRPPLTNMAFSLTRHGLAARPLLYGMILFAKMLGPGAELIPLHLLASPSLHLKAWAVRVNGGLMHVLVLNKAARSVLVRVRVPQTKDVAAVQRLRAPSIASTAGVTLGHQYLTRAATWGGRSRTQRVARSPRGFVIAVPGYSGALMTLHLR